MAAAAADQNLYRFAQSALLEPLQMANHDWPNADTAGRQPGGWGLRLRPMDMLKLGQLYLQRGEWNGKRRFAAEFPELAWASGATSVYALHWWVGVAPEAKGTPYFYANGVKGQRIFVFPTLGVVASVSATLPVAEIRAIDALIVSAIVGAAATDDRATAGTIAALMQRQAQSFNGETRTALTEQDRPRR